MERGKVLEDGPVAEVSAAYLKQGAAHPGLREWPDGESAPGDGVVRLHRVAVRGPDGQIAAGVNIARTFDVEIEYRVHAAGVILFLVVKIFNEWGTEVIWSTDAGTPQHGKPRAPGLYRSVVRFPAHLLAEGLMSVGVTIVSLRPRKIHVNESEAVNFQATDVVDGTSSRGAFSDYITSVIRPRLEWTVTVEKERATWQT